MILTAALWLAAMMQGQVKHCVLTRPLPMACICQPPEVAINPETQCFPEATDSNGQHYLLLDCVNRSGNTVTLSPCGVA